MSFLTVVKSAQLEALKGAGLVGLAPSPAKDEQLDDPLAKGVPGFIAQLKSNNQYLDKFEPVFSFYLSNDTKVKGKMLFGGADYIYAKRGLGENDVYWMKQSENKQYWAVDNTGVSLGQGPIVDTHQQIILDNGMSFAMAPTKTF